MVVEYRDGTPFTGDNHTPTELANAIRTKKNGKDVREPIAQLAEQTSADVYDDRQTVQNYKNHANNEEQALHNLVNKLSQEFENVLNAKSDYVKMFPEDTVTA